MCVINGCTSVIYVEYIHNYGCCMSVCMYIIGLFLGSTEGVHSNNLEVAMQIKALKLNNLSPKLEITIASYVVNTILSWLLDYIAISGRVTLP